MKKIRLKTPGIITEEEYRQAELVGRFTLTDEVDCSYCLAPMKIHTDPLECHCPEHGRLELRMFSNQGNQNYGTMRFYFEKVNTAVFDKEQRLGDLAKYKGCPFCNRNLRGRANQENQPIVEQRLYCDQCQVDFQIQVRGQSLWFQPKEEYLAAETQKEGEEDTQHNSQQTPDNVEEDTQHVEHNETQLTDGDLAERFISTHIVTEAEHFQTSEGIYTQYERFVFTRNRTPIEDRKLYKRLRERYPVATKKRRRINGRLQYGFTGIRCRA